MFPGGESTTTSLIFIWGLILICSNRGCYRNFQTGDKAQEPKNDNPPAPEGFMQIPDDIGGGLPFG